MVNRVSASFKYSKCHLIIGIYEQSKFKNSEITVFKNF